MCIYFKTETEDYSIGKSKKIWRTGLVSETTQALFAELN